MGSVGGPNSDAPSPYDDDDTNNTSAREMDCSLQVVCSQRCPQWCTLPHPPDVGYYYGGGTTDDSGTTFSPLIIALITILGTVSLVIVYFFISKYCKRRRIDRRSRGSDQDPSGVIEDDRLSNPIIMNIDRLISAGLDEGLIKSFTVFKYRRGDGLVESTECAVCLNEFKEDDELRLLPNCTHAFHIPCIDAWLNAHSNCPICRASAG